MQKEKRKPMDRAVAARMATRLAGRLGPFRGGIYEQGFSLIEVLIALVVFSVGILAVASMQITSTGGNAKARYISEATNWGMDKMEDLLSRSYDDSALSDNNGDGTGQDSNKNGIDDDDEGTHVDGVANFGLGDNTATAADGTSTEGKYTIYWNVAVDQPIPNTKTIRVIVTHPLLDNPVVLDFVKTQPI